MTPEPRDDSPLSPSSPADRADLRALSDELDLAYVRARCTGYRAGSCQMQALCEAEARYQRAKNT